MANSISNLTEHTPLGNLTAKFASGSSTNVSLREDAPIGQINLRASPENYNFFQSLKNITGLEPPPIANNFTTSGEFKLFWLGPSEWLLTAPDSQSTKLIADLTAETLGQHVSIVHVSDNRTCLILSGPKSWTVLNKTCELDLHPRTWRTGQCAQTLVARVQVLLAITNDSNLEFRLFVRNSFAEHLAGFLLDAMLEFSE